LCLVHISRFPMLSPNPRKMPKASLEETTPLQKPSSQSLTDIAKTLLLSALVISMSVSQISFNNYLMKPGRFPFAVTLVLIHMVFSSASASLLFIVAPSWFPSLTDPARKVVMDRNFVLRKVTPISVFFAASLVLTNMAYLHLSVAFLQMVKESGVILVYFFSILAALEAFTLRQCSILGLLLIGTALAINGELHFSAVGFCIQGSALLCDCSRVVLQGVLTSGGGRKLDPLSYILATSPLCMMLLALVFSVATRIYTFERGSHMAVPSASDFAGWWPLLIANATLAFMLNLGIAALIRYTSPMAFVLCQVVKDVLTVLLSTVILQQTISKMQAVGFGIQVLACLMWGIVKVRPGVFQIVVETLRSWSQRFSSASPVSGNTQPV